MWRTPKREKPPNCTAVQMETGWSHWAVASAALATRRAVTVTAKVGNSGRAWGVHINATLAAFPDPASLSVPVHQPLPSPQCSSASCHPRRSSTLFMHHLRCSRFFASLSLLSFHFPLYTSHSVRLSLTTHPFNTIKHSECEQYSISISCCWDGYKTNGNKSKWE